MQDLAPGSTAPAFELPTAEGGVVSLADFAERNIVLFFYPKADTPGCTQEAIEFSALQPAFEAANTAVVGISADPVEKLAAFKARRGLTVTLVSDQERQAIEAYGAWGEKSLYGKRYMGILRTTVLLDRAHRIAQVWRNVKVKNHAETVLDAAKTL